MSLWEKIFGIVIIIGIWLTTSKMQRYEHTISELRSELRKAERELELKQSTFDWLNGAYEELEERYFKALETHNIPFNWEKEIKEETNDKNSTLH